MLREPSLKHLTDPSYGVPREQQKPALQELTQAHVESFNYAVREGLGHAVQVSAAPQVPPSSALAGAAPAGEGEGPGGTGAVRQEGEGEKARRRRTGPQRYGWGSHSIILNDCAP